jgi:tetratricopeptide (TPR) repeat protein
LTDFGEYSMTCRALCRNRYGVNLLAGLGLLGLLLISYANSFDASWQYDDFGNIVNNPGIHMTRWSWDQLAAVFSAGLSHQLVSRPLAYLSFALNHRFGGLDVFGYHLFNFAVHWLSSFFLYLFVRNWLALPVFKGRYDRRATIIALIASAVWATHPIHVTAVTFIVQRMASMAGLFYIAAIYFYIKARSDGCRRRRRPLFALAALFGLCALMTKENTVLLFYALIGFEFLFIQGPDAHRAGKCLWWALGVTIFIGALGFMYTNQANLFRPFDIRPYTWLERLMTEPRVIGLYLSLLLFPMTSRMTLLHDIDISRSLFSPWTTVVSVAVLLVCIAVLVRMALARRHPLMTYCCFFFLLNHAIEGSIFNLELVYEHRNYIPAMLAFVPVGVAAARGLDAFRYRRSFQWMIGGTAALVLASQCYTTFAYNRVFETEHALWTHVTRRAPKLSLGHNNLGNIYWNSGRWDLAYSEFATAYRLDRYFNYRHKGLVHHNLGLYHMSRKRDYVQALFHFKAAAGLFPENRQIRYQLARAQMALGNQDGAVQTLSEAMDQWPDYAGFHYLMGVLRLKMGKCDEAIGLARQALDLDPASTGAFSVLAEAHRCNGDLNEAVRYWEKVLEAEPTDVNALLAFMDLNHQNSKPVPAMSYLDRLAAVSGGRRLDAVLDAARQYSSLGALVVDADRLKKVVQALVNRDLKGGEQ